MRSLDGRDKDIVSVKLPISGFMKQAKHVIKDYYHMFLSNNLSVLLKLVNPVYIVNSLFDVGMFIYQEKCVNNYVIHNDGHDILIRIDK